MLDYANLNRQVTRINFPHTFFSKERKWTISAAPVDTDIGKCILLLYNSWEVSTDEMVFKRDEVIRLLKLGWKLYGSTVSLVQYARSKRESTACSVHLYKGRAEVLTIQGLGHSNFVYQSSSENALYISYIAADGGNYLLGSAHQFLKQEVKHVMLICDENHSDISFERLEECYSWEYNEYSKRYEK